MALVRQDFHQQGRYGEGLGIAMVHTVVQRDQWWSSRYAAAGRNHLVAAQEHLG